MNKLLTCFTYNNSHENNNNKLNKEHNKGDNKYNLNILERHYEKGDFSFIEDTYFRNILEYDYNAINNIGHQAWDLLRFNNFRRTFRDNERRSFDLDREYNDEHNFENNVIIHTMSNIWDTPPGISWRHIKDSMSQTHTEYTFNRNIKILAYIAIHGWQGYVISHKLKYLAL